MSQTADNGLQYLGSLGDWKGSPDFGLTKISSVLKFLGSPHERVRAIHITGTNGKGSTSASIAAILGAGGARVGLTISPHLSSINERIVIDGCSIDNETLGNFAWEVGIASQRCGVTLSFFEGVTATAFLAFSELSLDWAVLEVGLGGRLDGTNVIRHPLGTAITSISLDHEAILGDDLKKIAAEKAGIIKSGAPLVTGRLPKEAEETIGEISRSLNVDPVVLGRDFDVTGTGESFRFVADGIGTHFKSRLVGAHQAENLGVAIRLCREIGIPLAQCQAGISSVFWPGRLEQITVGSCTGYLDCAHNIAGVKALVNFLKDNNINGLVVGFGALDTKRWQEMIELLCPFVSQWNILRPDSTRAL